MPFLTMNIHAEIDDHIGLSDEAVNIIAEELDKPKKSIVVMINEIKHMTFNGSGQNHGALLVLKSIGFKNKDKLVQRLTSLTTRLTTAEQKYVSIQFVDMARDCVAEDGVLLG